MVNRVGLDTTQISLKKAQETIGRDIYWQIPNDYRVMSEVRNNGVSLLEQAPRASVTQAILGLAESISGNTVTKDEDAPDSGKGGKSGSWRSFWPGKSKA